MPIYLFIGILLIVFLLFIYCLTRAAGEADRREDDRQQMIFLEHYRREHDRG
ncbi:MAG: hypothetical protein LUF34_06500 [Lachnospiraceae bacterium]|nr:hypothetical protein [Lachnospiraceae bacterium]